MKSFTKIFLLTLALFSFNFVANAETEQPEVPQTEITESTDLSLAQTPADDLNEVANDVKNIVNDLPKIVDTRDQLVSWETFLYAMITLIVGFLSKYIPVLNNIDDKWERVAAAAIALVLGLTIYKGALPLFDIIQYVISFVVSTRLIYPAVAKPIIRKLNPKIQQAVAA